MRIKRLQLTPNSSFQSIRGSVLAAGGVPQRWRSALPGAAEPPLRWAAMVHRLRGNEGRARRAFLSPARARELLATAGPLLRPRDPARRPTARAGGRGVPEPGTAPRAAAGTRSRARPTRDDRSLSDPRLRPLASAGSTRIQGGGASRGLATRKPTLLFSFVGSLSFRFDAARLFGLLLNVPPRRPRFEPLVLLVPRPWRTHAGPAG
jgi:hypothetical protein